MKLAVWMGARMIIENRKQLKIIHGKYTLRTRTNENRRAE